MNNNKKLHGQVYTPQYMVKNMLNYAEYNTGKHILKKHFMDNSCGMGAFLCKAVKRYIRSAMEQHYSNREIVSDLETYIHGIDNDTDAVNKCVSNLNDIAARYDIRGVVWDIRCEDTLTVTEYDGMMDFVVCNPPYVRVHNLSDSYDAVKTFEFAKKGMTDLYLVFFEIGFRMLSPKGVMCYITPSSWLNSVSGKALREYMARERNLMSITDFGHYQIFKGNSTYTSVTVFNKATRIPYFDYYQFDEVKKKRELKCLLSYDDITIDGKFYLDRKENLDHLREIKSCACDKIQVKNGFATLSDNSFIGEHIPDSPITIPIIKASTGHMTKCLYPYDKDGNALPYDTVFSYKTVAEHLNREMPSLTAKKRDGGEWYNYGRTQAINDVYRPKITVNNLLRDKNDLKVSFAEEGCGVYSGFYILGDITLDMVADILRTDDFVSYVKMLRKYKSGGYYTFGSKDLEQYLNFKLSKI